MITIIRRVLESERGVGMVMVVGFMGLCVPILTAGLALAGAMSNDSLVKSNLAKTQYSSIGALEYIRYLTDVPERWDDWLDNHPEGESLVIGEDDVEIEAELDGYSDYGFLEYCIFGNTSVHVKENSTINCSIGSNGDITIKEDSVVTGDITSGGDVVLKENVTVSGSVTAAGSVATSSGVSVGGSIFDYATVENIAGPTPSYGVTITLTNQNTGEVVEEYVSVDASQLPLTFNLEAGGADVTIRAGDPCQLAPDTSYGTVEVKENATLCLSTGSYAFDEFHIKEGATINLDVGMGPIVVDAVTVLEFKENVEMNVIGGSAADVVFRVQDQAQFKEDGVYVGTYFGFEASNAQMHVKENSTLTGALYGDVVEVKEHAEVHGMPAESVYLSFFGS